MKQDNSKGGTNAAQEVGGFKMLDNIAGWQIYQDALSHVVEATETYRDAYNQYDTAIWELLPADRESGEETEKLYECAAKMLENTALTYRLRVAERILVSKQQELAAVCNQFATHILDCAVDKMPVETLPELRVKLRCEMDKAKERRYDLACLRLLNNEAGAPGRDDEPPSEAA